MDVREEAKIDAYFSHLDRLDVLIANAGADSRRSRDWFARQRFHGSHECESARDFSLRTRGPEADGAPKKRAYRADRFAGGEARDAGAKAPTRRPRAGLVGLAQSLAKEYGARNIRCNVVLPGFLETRMTAGGSRRSGTRTSAQSTCWGDSTRWGMRARAIAFLARLDHVSGQVFALDSRLDRWT